MEHFEFHDKTIRRGRNDVQRPKQHTGKIKLNKLTQKTVSKALHNNEANIKFNFKCNMKFSILALGHLNKSSCSEMNLSEKAHIWLLWLPLYTIRVYSSKGLWLNFALLYPYAICDLFFCFVFKTISLKRSTFTATAQCQSESYKSVNTDRY